MSQNHQNPEHVDVIVVGAGLAGLSAAYRLSQQGVSVRVVEARDRIGGRVVDHRTQQGYVVPLGGGWLGPNEKRLPALIGELGLEILLEPVETGQALIEVLGQLRRFDSSKNFIEFREFDTLAADYTDDIMRLQAHLETLCHQIPLETPYAAEQAAEWDSISLADWYEQSIPDKALQVFFKTVVESVITVDIGKVSLLYFLFFWRATVLGIVDNRRVKGGPMQICHRMAEKLGDRVHLGAPVRSIHQHDGGVTVQSDAGVFSGSRAIVALSPVLSRDIDYQPALPEMRRELTQRMAIGEMIKCFMIYDRPFWRDMGLSGTMCTDGAPFVSTADYSPVDGGEHGVLVGFISGNNGKAWTKRSQEERREAGLEQLTKIYGPQAAHPLEYIDQDWNAEPWTRGYISYMPPEVAHVWNAWREPVGRIHWAGTETSHQWYGTMEGAVMSGERAAEEILSRIGG